jgi:hypothetical protein
MTGSVCQQHVISSSNSTGCAPTICSSGAGIRGLSPSLITATATAAGLAKPRFRTVRTTAHAHTRDTRDAVPEAEEGLFSGQQFPEDDAEAVHVGQDVINVGRLVQDLGRGPVDAADVVVRASTLVNIVLELGQPKVAHLSYRDHSKVSVCGCVCV